MKAAWRKKPVDTVGIRESIDSLRAQRVDAENCILYGVKILGLQSDNRRKYTRECVRDAIDRRLYEGVPFRINHQSMQSIRAGEDRNVYETAGVFRNIVQGDDGCPYGDLHLLKTHDMTPRIIEAAQRELANAADKFFGLSHDSFWLEREVSDGIEVITKLRRVASVDLVADPATNQGLFESRRRAVAKVTIRKLLESAGLRFKEGTVGRALAKRLVEQNTEDVNDGEAAMEADEPEKLKPEEHLKKGMMEACHAVVEAEDMSWDDKAARIKEIGNAHEKLTGKGDEKEEAVGKDEGVDNAEEGEPKKTPATESRKGDADKDRRLRELEEKDICRELCESKNFRPSSVQLRALVPLDKNDRLTLIEDFKKTAASRVRTQGGGSARESKALDTSKITDGKSFAENLRERQRTFRRN